MKECRRCDGTGFLNWDLLPKAVADAILEGDHIRLGRAWIKHHPTDFKVCDCCGNGDEPGYHGEWRYGKNQVPACIDEECSQEQLERRDRERAARERASGV